ncbi:MAG: RNA polymerase sigma factor [Solibacillus sp.]|uniref:RNA polymerase sigma factor n=1 Tax=unclassified Solibacillus TaxID=2637870 RepID=UPI0030F6D0E8
MNKRLEQQFIQYVRDNKKQLYLLAYSYVKNEQDALDVVQESIQKAWQSLHTLINIEQMKSWLYKIVVRTAIDFLRKMKRIQVMDDETLSYLCEEKYDEYRDTDLEIALDHLPMQFKEVIILRYFEDLKIEDIAEILSIPLSTAKSRLYKALKLLKIELDDGGEYYEKK